MLQRIDADQAELGMFIQRLEGNWFSHPFWKKRFLLTDPDDLAALRESSVKGVIIDTSRGKGAGPSDAAIAQSSRREPERTSAPSAVRPRSAAPAQTHGTVTAAELPIAREFGTAQKLINRSGKVISQIFLKARLGQAVRLAEVEPLVDDIYHVVQRNQYAFTGLLRCKQNKEEVYRHALSVCALMVSFARQLRLSQEEIREAGLAGLLMDVGVGQLPESLEEVGGDYRALRQELLDQHILFGHDLLSVAGEIPKSVLQVCLDHHERLDGSGYPQGLVAGEIDRLSRMAAICDEFDYLVAGGYGRAAMDPAAAVGTLTAQVEKFDPVLLETFIESIGVYPIGSFVILASGRVAMVVDVDRDDPSCPVVRTFYSMPLGKPVRGQTINMAWCFGEDSIEGIADLSELEIEAKDTLRERLMKAACRA